MVSMKMSLEDNTQGFKENHKKGLKMIKYRLIACLALVCSFGCLASCSVDTSKKPSDKVSTTTPSDIKKDDFKTDSNIKVYTRPTTSGTRECFFEKIGYANGKKGGLVSKANEVAENGDMLSAIANDTYGIGYASLDSLKNNTSVKGLKFEGVEATSKNALNGTYKLKRYFNIVADTGSNADSDLNDLAKAYWDFTFSKQGLAIASQNGGIVNADVLKNAASFKTLDYTIFTKDVSSKTIGIAGSTSVKNISTATENAFIALWTDSTKAPKFDISKQTGSGTAVPNLQSKTAQIGYLSRELDDAELTTLGGITGSKHDHICTDAVVAIVNAKNTSVSNITGTQLARIYLDSKDTQWSDLFKDGVSQITKWNELA